METLDNDSILAADNFVPSDYIKERLHGTRTGDETRKLNALRSEMSAVNSASQQLLKNNVFQNYQQFIDASKEISHLEREIYQLSSMLADQKQMIENLIQMTGDDKTSIHTVSSHSTTTGGNPVQILLQKMNGVAGILNNLKSSDRIILHSEMVQLDGETKEQMGKSLLVLLNDRLLIGAAEPSGKYNLESTFSLNNVAIVNVRDRESRSVNAEQLLKLLIFPDQRYYRCETARVKKMWLDEVEQAKRQLLHAGSLVRQATIRGKRKTVQERAKSLTPVADRIDEHDPQEDERKAADISWLEELPAEVDDCIAHRDLEQAVELLVEWQMCKTKLPAVDAQLTARKNQVIHLLSEDVRRPEAVHGGPRAMKKACSLLAQLGRGTFALDLYLKRRSNLHRAKTREVAASDEPLSYVRQLCLNFSQSVHDVVNEFRMQPHALCQILKWCSVELSVILTLIERHVVEVAPTVAVLSKSWLLLAQTIDELADLGLDLSFQVHRLLCPSIDHTINTIFTNMMNSVRLRISEEQWKPLVTESESAQARLVEELNDVGLSVDWTKASNNALHVSQHAIVFAQTALSVARDFSMFDGSPVFNSCEKHIVRMWMDYLKHLSEGICDSTVYAYTATFILTQALPLCEKTMWGKESDDLSSLLPQHFPKLVPYVKADEEEDEDVAHI